jgi:hypothetical protein
MKSLFLLMILLLPLAVYAQPGPLVITEHDWSICAGGKLYGVQQHYWRGDPKYGGGRYTIVYVGTPRFTVRTRAGFLVAPAAALLLCGIGVFLLPRRESRTERAAQE